MTGAEILSLNCPNCGGSLEIPSGLKNLVCNYCKSSLQLFQNESVTALQILSEGLDGVRNDTTKIASELALSRIQSEINSLQKEKDKKLGIISEAAENEYLGDLRREVINLVLENPIIHNLTSSRKEFYNYWNLSSSIQEPELFYDLVANYLKREDFLFLVEILINKKESYILQPKKRSELEKIINSIKALIELDKDLEEKENQKKDILTRLR
jgi:hypothetical protein